MGLEFRRKLFHILAGLLWLLPLFYLPKVMLLFFSFLVLLLNLGIVLRLAEDKLTLVYRLVYLLERQRNSKRPSIQALWLNIGVFLSFLFFPKECAAVGIVLTAVGDGFAGLVGYHFGKRRLWDKSWEGFLAFFVFSGMALFPFFGISAFLVAFVGAVVEVMPKRLDDNFLLPLVGSGLAWILSN